MSEDALGGMIDSNVVALLGKFNDLCERFGIPPCEIVATVQDGPSEKACLVIETPPSTSSLNRKFFRMLGALGLSHDNHKVAGSEQEIYSVLVRAIDRAPKRRLG